MRQTKCPIQAAKCNLRWVPPADFDFNRLSEVEKAAVSTLINRRKCRGHPDMERFIKDLAETTEIQRENPVKERRAAVAAEQLRPLIPRFSGKTALVFATGESLPSLWEGRSSDLPKIVISDAWKIVKDPDILYSTDWSWWSYHKPKVSCLKVVYETIPYDDNFVAIQGAGTLGFDKRLGFVKHGSNSGCAATHLAAQLGATRIVLVGFDMKGKHFFGDHPREVARPGNFPAFMKRFKVLGEALAARGIEVLNATPGSAMTHFRFVDIGEFVKHDSAS